MMSHDVCLSLHDHCDHKLYESVDKEKIDQIQVALTEFDESFKPASHSRREANNNTMSFSCGFQIFY